MDSINDLLLKIKDGQDVDPLDVCRATQNSGRLGSEQRLAALIGLSLSKWKEDVKLLRDAYDLGSLTGEVTMDYRDGSSQYVTPIGGVIINYPENLPAGKDITLDVFAESNVNIYFSNSVQMPQDARDALPIELPALQACRVIMSSISGIVLIADIIGPVEYESSNNPQGRYIIAEYAPSAAAVSSWSSNYSLLWLSGGRVACNWNTGETPITFFNAGGSFEDTWGLNLPDTLTELNMSGTQINTSPYFENFANLGIVNLSSTPLSTPPTLTGLVALNTLDLSNTHILDGPEISGVPLLDILISNTLMSDAAVDLFVNAVWANAQSMGLQGGFLTIGGAAGQPTVDSDDAIAGLQSDGWTIAITTPL